MPDKTKGFELVFGKEIAGIDRFRNPFNDYASKMLPKDIIEALDFAEFIWFANPTFSRGCTNISRYFITELEVDIKDDTKATDLKDFFIEKLEIIKLIALLGDDFMCYGNSFWSVILPFKRNLLCPESGLLVPIEEAFEHNLVEWKDFSFRKTREGIKKAGGSKKDFTISDIPLSNVNDLIVKRWKPQSIDITADEWSGDKVYHWRIPQSFAKDIKDGKLSSLIKTPKEVIDAVKNDEKRFTFNKGTIFHAADEVVSGVDSGGWGIPLVIRNFRHIYRTQLLDRYDEAVNLDYIAGLRVISPGTSGTGTSADPIKNMGMDKFSGHVQNMIKKHRQDPTTWHTSSFPLEYRLMGAEGAQLTPIELKEHADGSILNSIGLPEDMYRMNLQLQSAPMALRLFEKTWTHLTFVYNNFLNWVGDTVATRFKHDQAKFSLKKVTLADDLALPDILLQLMSGQQVSPQTALAGLGIGDYREEVRKVYEAEKIRAEEEAAFQEEMEQEQAYQEFKAQLAEQQMMQEQAAMGGGGGMPLDPGMEGGGMPPPGPMAPPAGPGSQVQVNQEALNDPIAMEQEAQRIAEEIFALPNRRSILADLTKTNNTLAAVVKEKIRQIEQQAARQGIDMAKQQGGM